MDPKTGKIYAMTPEGFDLEQFRDARSVLEASELMTEEQARDRGFVAIPPEELERVRAMSSEERKAWAKLRLQAEAKKRSNEADHYGNRHQRRRAASLARKKNPPRTQK